MSNKYGMTTANNKGRIYMHAPACGCDGKTYSNSCVAASAGVNIAQEGECQEECVYRSPGKDNCTNANEYCVIDERNFVF